MGKKTIRPAARWASDLFESEFSSPLLQRFTSHSHVRHGLYSHQILCAASLDLLKIKNVANHKYLKSPGAGICTVFKQTFLIWYLLFFFSVTATCLSQGCGCVLFFSFPLSGSIKFHVAPAQLLIPMPSPGTWECSLSWPLHLFPLFILSGFCSSIWWSAGTKVCQVAGLPSAPE